MNTQPNRTHTEAVERVAEALFRSSNQGGMWTWATIQEFEREPYRRQAIVAIEAHTAALGGLTEEQRSRRIPGTNTTVRYVRLASRWVAVPDSGGEA